MWKGRTHRHGPSRSVRKGGVLQTHCAEGARIHTGSFLQNSVHSAVVLDTAVSQQRGVLDAPVRSVPEAGIRHADCMRWASLSDPFQCSAVGHCLPVLETLDVASLELCSTRTTLPRADRARPTRLHTVLSWGPLSIAAHMVAAMVNILGTAFGGFGQPPRPQQHRNQTYAQPYANNFGAPTPIPIRSMGRPGQTTPAGSFGGAAAFDYRESYAPYVHAHSPQVTQQAH